MILNANSEIFKNTKWLLLSRNEVAELSKLFFSKLLGILNRGAERHSMLA